MEEWTKNPVIIFSGETFYRLPQKCPIRISGRDFLAAASKHIVALVAPCYFACISHLHETNHEWLGVMKFPGEKPSPEAAPKIYFETVEMKKEQLLDLYHQMVLIRRVEERGAELYQAGKIGGFMHLYIGQEAVSTGLIAAREPRDRVITAYRDHGVAINCGIPAEQVMAELLGKIGADAKRLETHGRPACR